MSNKTTIDTVANAFVPMFASSQAVGALPSVVPQSADPANLYTGIAAGVTGVQDIAGKQSVTGANFGKFVFTGVGAEDTNYIALLVGWQSVAKGTAAGLWIPIPLANLTITLGAATGPSGGSPFTTTTRFADGIAVNSSIINPNYDIFLPDPTNCPLSMLRLDLSGFERIQAYIGTGTATSGNVLMSGF